MIKAGRKHNHRFLKLANTIFLFLSLVLLADMIKPFKTIIRSFFSTFLDLNLFFILCGYYKTLHCYIVFSWWILLISFSVFWLIKTHIFPVFYRTRWKKMLFESTDDPAAHLQRELFRYVTGSDNISFLVYGSWGVGKTTLVNHFVENMKKSRLRPVHSISCFGLSSREALVAEIKKVCEANDTSLKKRFLDVLHGIPFIGDLLHSLLKKDYDLPNISRDTVWIGYTKLYRKDKVVGEPAKIKDNLLRWKERTEDPEIGGRKWERSGRNTTKISRRMRSSYRMQVPRR